ncbi:hypothetical protein [Herbidospora cretacea]|uniref:hypothetical protein n=1 Tax=Herbidospora cretacea TaxID=28444 RepID=UPI000774CC6B|nr:hypothetical protein [Herbidospora cretacea]
MARRKLYVGAAVLAVGLVVAVPWAEDLRFAYSSEEMEEFARTLEDGVEIRDADVGLLSFMFIREENGQVVFYRGRTWGQDGYGYIWSPDGRPAETRHLKGPWYGFRDDAHM